MYEFDYYGDWRNLDNYGYAWSPRVDAGWSPYQTGYWYTDYPYGPTWISSEPWGYAPYHYGRWAFVGDRWYWVPDTMNTTPAYSPALVAFVPFSQNEIGWVPLGPGDVYVPHYYTNDWQPQYLTRGDLYQRVVNLNVPGAVTVVSVDDFTRGGFDWRRARKADRNMLAQVNPVLDPLLVTPLRNAVVNSAWGRGKIDIPPGIARKLNDTPVVTSTEPVAPRFKPDLNKTLRVNPVSDRAKGQKFQVRDERKGRGAPQAQAPVQVQQPPPVEQRGRGQEQREARRVEQAPSAPQAERAARPVRQQQPRGERVAAPQQQQRPVKQERQQQKQERPAARQQQQPQAERAARPVQQQQPRGERVAAPQQQQRPVKQERPAPAQKSQGGSKGKGKKP